MYYVCIIYIVYRRDARTRGLVCVSMLSGEKWRMFLYDEDGKQPYAWLPLPAS